VRIGAYIQEVGASISSGCFRKLRGWYLLQVGLQKYKELQVGACKTSMRSVPHNGASGNLNRYLQKKGVDASY